MIISIVGIIFFRSNLILNDYVETAGEHILIAIEKESLGNPQYYSSLIQKLSDYGITSVSLVLQDDPAHITGLRSQSIVYTSNGVQIVFLRSFVRNAVQENIINGVLFVGIGYFLIILFTFILDYLYTIRPFIQLQADIYTSFSVGKSVHLPSRRNSIADTLASLINHHIIPYVQSYNQNTNFTHALNRKLGTFKKFIDVSLSTSKRQQDHILSADFGIIRICLQNLSAAHESLNGSRQEIDSLYETTKQINSISVQCISLVSELHAQVTDLHYLKNKILPISQNMAKTTKSNLENIHVIKNRTTNLLTTLIHHRNSLTSITTFTNQAQLLAMNASIEGSQSFSESDPMQVILTELQSMAKESNKKAQDTVAEMQEYEVQINEINTICTKLIDTQSAYLETLRTFDSIERSYDESVENLRSIEHQFKYSLHSLKQTFKERNKSDIKITTTQTKLHEIYEELRKSIGTLEEHTVSGSKNMKGLVHTLEELSTAVRAAYEDLSTITAQTQDYFLSSEYLSDTKSDSMPTESQENVTEEHSPLESSDTSTDQC